MALRLLLNPDSDSSQESSDTPGNAPDNAPGCPITDEQLFDLFIAIPDDDAEARATGTIAQNDELEIGSSEFLDDEMVDMCDCAETWCFGCSLGPTPGSLHRACDDETMVGLREEDVHLRHIRGQDNAIRLGEVDLHKYFDANEASKATEEQSFEDMLMQVAEEMGISAAVPEKEPTSRIVPLYPVSAHKPAFVRPGEYLHVLPERATRAILGLRHNDDLPKARLSVPSIARQEAEANDPALKQVYARIKEGHDWVEDGEDSCLYGVLSIKGRQSLNLAGTLLRPHHMVTAGYTQRVRQIKQYVERKLAAPVSDAAKSLPSDMLPGSRYGLRDLFFEEGCVLASIETELLAADEKATGI